MFDWVLNTPLNILTGSNPQSICSMKFKKFIFCNFWKSSLNNIGGEVLFSIQMKNEGVGLQLYFKKLLLVFSWHL